VQTTQLPNGRGVEPERATGLVAVRPKIGVSQITEKSISTPRTILLVLGA
jgi:hypothetical protein